jgi:3-hydroxyacyl-[acyl-carrier-protein] dehydratase
MTIEIMDIQKMIPHRYPFLLVDRILEVEPGARVSAIKNVTINEAFFQGHFPGKPIMPGVLIVEGMAQAGGVLVYKSGNTDDNVVYFMSIDHVKFRKPVVPGDQLRFEVTLVKNKGKIWKFRGEARVGDDLVCEADFMAMTARE